MASRHAVKTKESEGCQTETTTPSYACRNINRRTFFAKRLIIYKRSKNNYNKSEVRPDARENSEE
jgi:hypothetical protein